MPDFDRELRTCLQQYLLSGGAMQQLQEWLVRQRWQHQEQPLSALAKATELYLAEYTNGDRTEPELRSELLRLLEGPLWTDRSQPPPDWESPGRPIQISEKAASTAA